MKAIVTGVLLSLLATIGQAQLTGSGKIVARSYDFKQFTKIHFQDLDGRIDVMVGDSFKVELNIDDNLAPLLEVSSKNNGNELLLRLVNNQNNRRYVENSNLRIRISLPTLVAVQHSGNSQLFITGIQSSFEQLTNSGNGNVTCSGVSNALKLCNDGNGNLNLTALLVNKITINNIGNGNCVVNAALEIIGNVIGNGSITNKGEAVFGLSSSRKGNGRLFSTNNSAN